eukprot:TRINITY_DN1245_c0_g1_i1.p1 TRINITY_DN1245_c0_g1~~TRINITY_DN1245_c0_g1_i1.p1  ORF type:complete len:385 (-),score=55.46 TRINITY_DN1245_c0_g1_i1:42-1196(-)
MAYYFLGSQIIDKQEDTTWYKICQSGFGTTPGSMDSGHRLHIQKEKFRGAIVDTLINLTDHLGKLDLNLDSIIRKIEKQHKDIDSEPWDIKINTNAGEIDILKYIQEFSWEDSKYPRSKSLAELVHLLQTNVVQFDSDIKKQMTEYIEMKNTLAALNKKQEGGYATRDLTEVFINNNIEKSMFVDSHYLVSLIAIVGKNQTKIWNSSYEKLEEFVVPKSSKPLNIVDSDGNQLYTVVVFKQNADTFIMKARNQLKVSVRYVEFNEESYREDQKTRNELTTKIREQETELKKNCEIVYSELFECMMHLKILKVHIECVLRWGLPPDYLLSMLRLPAGKENKVMQNLIKLYASKEEKGVYGYKDEIGESEDYFPFILISMGLTIPT